MSDEEMAAETADLHAQLDLFEEAQVDAWLARMHLTAAELDQDMRGRLLIASLRLHLFPDGLVDERFRASFHDYGTAAVDCRPGVTGAAPRTPRSVVWRSETHARYSPLAPASGSIRSSTPSRSPKS